MDRPTETLVLLGASVRALAGSALRAGLQPYGLDLFTDLDLIARCPAMRLTGRYPETFLDALPRAPAGPWMYTGGLENHPALLETLAESRPCWGIVGAPLRAVRSPALLAERLRRAGLPVPGQHRNLECLPERGRWLVKPRRGAGGSGIRLLSREGLLPEERRGIYLQEQIPGVPCAAVYVGDGPRTRLLGMSMQLIGTQFLNSAPFRYAGSIGPMPIDPMLRSQLVYLGHVLGEQGGLRGLFGVDGILRAGTFWPVEVNPRYTASMEVIEFATGIAIVGQHRRVFDRSAPEPEPFAPAGMVVGKAIVNAPHDTVFPADGPWSATRDRPPPITQLPPVADIPATGESIPMGRPVLSVLASATSIEGCLVALQGQARAVLDALPVVS